MNFSSSWKLFQKYTSTSPFFLKNHRKEQKEKSKKIRILLIINSDMLINQLWVTSYDLFTLRVAFIAWATSYCLLHVLRVICLYASYECQLITWVTSYFSTTNYDNDKDEKAIMVMNLW